MTDLRLSCLSTAGWDGEVPSKDGGSEEGYLFKVRDLIVRPYVTSLTKADPFSPRLRGTQTSLRESTMRNAGAEKVGLPSVYTHRPCIDVLLASQSSLSTMATRLMPSTVIAPSVNSFTAHRFSGPHCSTRPLCD